MVKPIKNVTMIEHINHSITLIDSIIALSEDALADSVLPRVRRREGADI